MQRLNSGSRPEHYQRCIFYYIHFVISKMFTVLSGNSQRLLGPGNFPLVICGVYFIPDLDIFRTIDHDRCVAVITDH